MKWLPLTLLLLASFFVQAQILKIKDRKTAALGGSRFTAIISDTGLTLKQREKLIYKTIKHGNIPEFYRNLIEITDSAVIDNIQTKIQYFVIPDYIAIGSNQDYFYCPMTPGLAQKVANKLHCSLPTRKMVDRIYSQAIIKLAPLPIPPSKAMSTVPAFIKHNQMVRLQLDSLGATYTRGKLTDGDKKNVVISNRIYNDTSNYHVVIYGWHKKANGKAIQPLYAKHLNTWADYSHGIRLVQNICWVNGKKTSIKKVLQSEHFNILLSDEGSISKPHYPAKFISDR